MPPDQDAMAKTGIPESQHLEEEKDLEAWKRRAEVWERRYYIEAGKHQRDRRLLQEEIVRLRAQIAGSGAQVAGSRVLGSVVTSGAAGLIVSNGRGEDGVGKAGASSVVTEGENEEENGTESSADESSILQKCPSGRRCGMEASLSAKVYTKDSDCARASHESDTLDLPPCNDGSRGDADSLSIVEKFATVPPAGKPDGVAKRKSIDLANIEQMGGGPALDESPPPRPVRRKVGVCLSVKEAIILRFVPAEVRDRFNKPAFGRRWKSKVWLPAMEIGPIDVPDYQVREKYFEMLDKCKKKGCPPKRLVRWYGVENKSRMFSFLDAGHVVPYETGIDLKYNILPWRIQKKINTGSLLTEVEEQHIKGLELMERDLPPSKESSSESSPKRQKISPGCSVAKQPPETVPSKLTTIEPPSVGLVGVSVAAPTCSKAQDKLKATSTGRMHVALGDQAIDLSPTQGKEELSSLRSAMVTPGDSGGTEMTMVSHTVGSEVSALESSAVLEHLLVGTDKNGSRPATSFDSKTNQTTLDGTRSFSRHCCARLSEIQELLEGNNSVGSQQKNSAHMDGSEALAPERGSKSSSLSANEESEVIVPTRFGDNTNRAARGEIDDSQKQISVRKEGDQRAALEWSSKSATLGANEVESSITASSGGKTQLATSGGISRNCNRNRVKPSEVDQLLAGNNWEEPRQQKFTCTEVSEKTVSDGSCKSTSTSVNEEDSSSRLTKSPSKINRTLDRHVSGDDGRPDGCNDAQDSCDGVVMGKCSSTPKAGTKAPKRRWISRAERSSSGVELVTVSHIGGSAASASDGSSQEEDDGSGPAGSSGKTTPKASSSTRNAKRRRSKRTEVEQLLEDTSWDSSRQWNSSQEAKRNGPASEGPMAQDSKLDRPTFEDSDIGSAALASDRSGRKGDGGREPAGSSGNAMPKASSSMRNAERRRSKKRSEVEQLLEETSWDSSHQWNSLQEAKRNGAASTRTTAQDSKLVRPTFDDSNIGGSTVSDRIGKKGDDGAGSSGKTTPKASSSMRNTKRRRSKRTEVEQLLEDNSWDSPRQRNSSQEAKKNGAACEGPMAQDSKLVRPTFEDSDIGGSMALASDGSSKKEDNGRGPTGSSGKAMPQASSSTRNAKQRRAKRSEVEQLLEDNSWGSSRQRNSPQEAKKNGAASEGSMAQDLKLDRPTFEDSDNEGSTVSASDGSGKKEDNGRGHAGSSGKATAKASSSMRNAKRRRSKKRSEVEQLLEDTSWDSSQQRNSLQEAKRNDAASMGTTVQDSKLVRPTFEDSNIGGSTASASDGSSKKGDDGRRTAGSSGKTTPTASHERSDSAAEEKCSKTPSASSADSKTAKRHRIRQSELDQLLSADHDGAWQQMSAKEEKAYRTIPEDVKSRFRQPSFGRWGTSWLPALELGPHDVPAGPVRDRYFNMLYKSIRSGSSLQHLVCWYAEERESYKYSFLRSKSVVPYHVGLEKNYGKLPKHVQKKLDCGEPLTKLETQYARGLELIHLDAAGRMKMRSKAGDDVGIVTTRSGKQSIRIRPKKPLPEPCSPPSHQNGDHKDDDKDSTSKVSTGTESDHSQKPLPEPQSSPSGISLGDGISSMSRFSDHENDDKDSKSKEKTGTGHVRSKPQSRPSSCRRVKTVSAVPQREEPKQDTLKGRSRTTRSGDYKNDDKYSKSKGNTGPGSDCSKRPLPESCAPPSRRSSGGKTVPSVLRSDESKQEKTSEHRSRMTQCGNHEQEDKDGKSKENKGPGSDRSEWSLPESPPSPSRRSRGDNTVLAVSEDLNRDILVGRSRTTQFCEDKHSKSKENTDARSVHSKQLLPDPRSFPDCGGKIMSELPPSEESKQGTLKGRSRTAVFRNKIDGKDGKSKGNTGTGSVRTRTRHVNEVNDSSIESGRRRRIYNECEWKGLSSREAKVLNFIPNEIQLRFGMPAFGLWRKQWLPVLELGPNDLPAGLMRKQYFNMLDKCKKSGRPIKRLVHWLAEENKDSILSYLGPTQVIPYDTGLRQNYHMVPEQIQKKLDSGEPLTRGERQHVKGLRLAQSAVDAVTKSSRISSSKRVHPPGTVCMKDFSGTLYAGRILSFDSELGSYKVLYEDGDFEDVKTREIAKIIPKMK